MPARRFDTWLDSLGYRIFMSEYCGSDKVLGPGTYDACFEAIAIRAAPTFTCCSSGHAGDR